MESLIEKNKSMGLISSEHKGHFIEENPIGVTRRQRKFKNPIAFRRQNLTRTLPIGLNILLPASARLVEYTPPYQSINVTSTEPESYVTILYIRNINRNAVVTVYKVV